MVKRVLGLFRCLKGGHERSERKIQKVGEIYVSRCRYCGVRMRRQAKRIWVVQRGAVR